MKKVEAPNPYVAPPAVNIEDMTQPMGPLEEGDQALVDAAHRVPEGRHEIRNDNGEVTWLGKQATFGQDIVTVYTATPEGANRDASILVNKIPGVEGISGDISDGGNRTHVSGNTVGEGVTGVQSEPNRRDAQAVKMVVADRVNRAQERADRHRHDQLAA